MIRKYICLRVRSQACNGRSALAMPPCTLTSFARSFAGFALYSQINSSFSKQACNGRSALAMHGSLPSRKKRLLIISDQKAIISRGTTSVVHIPHGICLTGYCCATYIHRCIRPHKYPSAVTGGTCRSLAETSIYSDGIPPLSAVPGSVRCLGAMFNCLPSDSSQRLHAAGIFSVRLPSVYSLRHCLSNICIDVLRLSHLPYDVNLFPATAAHSMHIPHFPAPERFRQNVSADDEAD